jgi:hypothetical protein
MEYIVLEIISTDGTNYRSTTFEGTDERDFYLDPDAGILIVVEQRDADSQNPLLPDGLGC